MWAGWIGTMEEKLTRGGIDPHYSDCQEGVNGGQGSVGNQDAKLTKQRDWHGHVHLHVGAVIRLRNFMLFIKKKRVFDMEKV